MLNSRQIFWRKSIPAFIILLLVASRIIGLGFEIPIVGSVPDEDYYVNTILKAFENKTLHIDFHWQPSFFFYLNLFAFTLFHWLLQAILFLLGLRDFLLPVYQENLFFIILFFGRLLSAMFGVLACLLLYRISKKLFPDSLSSWLVLLLALFNYQLIIYSHVAKMDILQVFLVLLCADLALSFHHQRRFLFYYLAVISAGLAAGTKLIGGAVLFLPGVFLLELIWREKNKLRLFGHGVLGLIVFGLTFLTTTPFILLDSQKAAWVFDFYRSLAENPQYAYLYQDKLARFLLNIRHLFSWPELFFALAGILVSVFSTSWRRRFDWLAILLFSLLFFSFGARQGFLDSRYYLPVAPFFMILAVVGFRSFSALKHLKKLQPLLPALLLIPAMIHGSKTILLLARPTTQMLSHNYLKQLPGEIPFAYEMLCGINPSNRALFSFSLGHTPYGVYRRAGHSFLIHNRNMYDMYFSMASGIQALPEVYESYQRIRQTTLRMKTLQRRPQIDFLNPAIDYLKFVNRENLDPGQAELLLQGRINNRSNTPVYLLAGDRLLALVSPGRNTTINRTFLINPERSREIFIFQPVFSTGIPVESEQAYFELDISLKTDAAVFTETIQGRTALNQPFTTYLKEAE